MKPKTKEEVLDEYFPKGNKKRGEAMAICVVAYLEGKEEMRKKVEKLKESKLNFTKEEKEFIDKEMEEK